MVKKRSLREKVTEKKEAKEKKAEGEKEEKEEKREHAADKSKWVIKIKKPSLKFLKSLKPIKPIKSLKSLKPLAIYFLLGAIAIIAAFFIFRGIITGPVAFGDKVNISYSLELEDGTLIDSSSGDFILGSISTEFGFISNKLDNVIKKMKAGEEKIIELEPADAFGEYDKQKIDTINRTIEWGNRTFIYPLESFKSDFGRSPKIGESLPFNQLWNVTIINITNETITLQHNLAEGDILPLEPDGNVTVHLEKDKIILTFTPGKQWFMSGILVDVVDITDKEIILDYNVPLAGNIVIVKVKVNEIEKAIATGKKGEIAGAPTLEAFVVSYCPFGLQMQRILVEVEKLLGTVANIKTRYIGSASGDKIQSMHGEEEATENLKQICIREEQSDKFWNYLSCFMKDGNSEECLNENKINKNQLERCMVSTGIDYAKEDFELMNKYGVTSSPTLILDGKKVSEFDFGGRTAEAVKQLICSAFATQPKECLQQLKTEQATTSFSKTYSGGASSSSSCG